MDTANITLTGPAGNPYNDIKRDWTTGTPSNGYIVFFKRGTQSSGGPFGTSFLPYDDGIYSVRINSTDQRTFYFSNVNMRNYMVIAIPTLHSENGKLTSVSLDYRLPNDSVVEPRNLLIGKVRIQINSQTQQVYEADGIYGNDDVTNYNYFEKKIDKQIDVNAITQINLAYIDLLGNEYEFIWRK
jgi:hypothetical protein